jgi:hypothetical protein
MIPAIAINIIIPSSIIVINFVTRIHFGFTGSFILLQTGFLRVDDFDLAITSIR